MATRELPALRQLPSAVESGLEGHCRRVAAWAGELALALGLNSDQKHQLERAAFVHHCPPLVLNPESRARLLQHVHVLETDAAELLPGSTDAILRSYHRVPAGGVEPGFVKLAAILEIANALDEYFELQPFQIAESEPEAETALAQLQVATRADLWNAIHRLPVFPAAAQMALRVLLGENWSRVDLELIAGSDPTLAAHIIRAANSALYSSSQGISTLPRAIMHMGADTCARILCAAAMKPFYGSRNFRQIWNHSLDAAQLTARLAELAGEKDPREAFLAGLMHDVGRLGMALLPAKFQEHYARLIEKGCEVVPVEQALCGFSHEEAGAVALRAWNFPQQIVDAVEFHHRPERTDSRLAALLYLTEHWLDTSEDLPSAARLHLALERLNLTSALRANPSVADDPALNGMKFVA